MKSSLNFGIRVSLVPLFLLLIMVGMPTFSHGQEKLNRLVEEREQLHRSWQASEEQKSGIFGNRTKKDMITTNEWMERIIKKDNQIMAELEMLKNIETAEISNEKEDYKYIAQKQQHDIDVLKRSLANKEQVIAEIKASKRSYEWAVFLLSLAVLAMGILHYRKVRKSRESVIISTNFSRHKQA
ncbi:Clp protease ClpB [Pleomorphovibrio marinus]|uniref:Clp protease ClpB n=1 Tax=Pleomorphovibrio marinus TaxID=2164132 RepID=UPI001E583790|nr:Clp protease ClpB [Pleomorphovibrio marinus]